MLYCKCVKVDKEMNKEIQVGDLVMYTNTGFPNTRFGIVTLLPHQLESESKLDKKLNIYYTERFVDIRKGTYRDGNFSLKNLIYNFGKITREDFIKKYPEMLI